MEPLPRPGSPSSAWKLPGAVLAAAFLVRGALALAFPTIHGGDAAARLANPGTLVLGYQLPLPQFFVMAGRLASDDPLVARLLFCLWGGVLAAGVAALVREAEGEIAGAFAGFLLAFDPLLIHYSVVPYQEAPAYGLVAWAAVALRRNRPWTSAAAMAAATLCRYEAWLFLPLFLLRCRSLGARLLAMAPVVAWISVWQGLAPRGLYVLDIDPSADRLPRLSFLLRKFLEYETAVPALLALVALGLLLRSGDRAMLGFLAWTAGVIATVIGLGHEFPPGSGLISERLVHLPVLVGLGLSALTLARVSRLSRGAAVACVIFTSFLAARNVRFETGLLEAASREPDLVLGREAARAIEAARRPGECVTVTAPPVDPELLRSYVAKVAASFGDAAVATGRAAALANASPDRDRIAAHLRAPAGTVRATRGCALDIRIDGDPDTPAPGRVLREITAGSRRAVLYRIRD